MSGIIKQLDANTINQIAAGEVVEEPSSVVKELVENSIDAGADHIVLKMQDGGKKLLEIFDNGKGMSQEDMKVCYLKHTTSKIVSAHDIVQVGTFGFRGEALASISSVARLKIQSKQEHSEYGYEIQVENSEVVHESVCAFPQKGTKIIVEDLFYNIPARKSFLEKEKSTKLTKNIIDLFHRLSLANPYIRFELFVDNVSLFRTSGNGNLTQILATIYNKEIAKNLIEVDTEVFGVKVRGFISKPEFCVGNKTKQTFFVNNRYVQMDILSTAIRNGYNEYAVTKKHPVCVLFFEIDKDKVDINVHPRKIEVRFKHSIYPVITSSVQQALFNSKSFPEVQLTKGSSSTTNYASDRQTAYNEVETFNKPSMTQNTEVVATPQSSAFNENKLSQNFAESMLLKDLAELDDTEESDDDNDVEDLQEELFEKQMEFENLDTGEINFTDYKNIQVLGQIHLSYIVAQHNKGMIMIDQHAAHERILYEKFSKAVENQDIISVETLIPDTIELSSSDYLIVKSHLDFFRKYGFELEDFGLNTFVIRKYPAMFKERQIKNSVMSMIDELLHIENKSVVDDFINKKVIMRSCKSAIKANMRLAQWQMEQLLKDLQKCDNPYHCPHGRPIIINFTTYEIEKSFNRVV